MKCGRCKAPITEETAEFCYLCHARLCFTCWDDVGHCGHAEAESKPATREEAP